MVNKDRLYQTFGELLYVVAITDGVIQKKEVQALEEILKAHPKGKEIIWSFNYENEHENDAEALYKKVMEVFSDHGPDHEYEFMLYALEKVANASKGKDGEEQKIITNFSLDLLERFKKDIEKIKEKYI